MSRVQGRQSNGVEARKYARAVAVRAICSWRRIAACLACGFVLNVLVAWSLVAAYSSYGRQEARLEYSARGSDYFRLVAFRATGIHLFSWTRVDHSEIEKTLAAEHRLSPSSTVTEELLVLHTPRPAWVRQTWEWGPDVIACDRYGDQLGVGFPLLSVLSSRGFNGDEGGYILREPWYGFGVGPLRGPASFALR